MPTIHFIEKYSDIHDFGLHKHDYWEIIYVISGSGKFLFQDGDGVDYNTGDIICIPPLYLHRNFPNAGFSNINLTLMNWTPGYGKPVLIPNLENSEFNYVDDLYYILDMTYRHFHYIHPNQNIIDNLINLLLAFIDSSIKAPNVSISSKIIQMKIVSDFGNPLFDLDAVYEEFPYSKRYLQRLFIKDYGISPSQFLLQQRLNAAIKYLNQTIKNDYSIAEISDRCGFGDQYYFSRIFKKQLGVCPKEYRQGKISTPPPTAAEVPVPDRE